MVYWFNIVFYQPLYNLLVFFYNIIPGNDIGLAIIALTIVVRVILYPFALQSIKSQKAMQDLQPKLSALKEKYKDKKDELAQEMVKLYKNEKVNPLSSCLPVLIQLPFLIAVYKVFQSGLNSSNLNLLYSFVQNPNHINSISLGFLDLGKPSYVLAILAGAAQFWQTKMLLTSRPPKGMPGSKDEDITAIMNKQMVYFMPLITVVIGVSLPGGLTLYWFVTTLLMALQQLYFFKKKKAADIIPAEANNQPTI
jgi:YidC/Oxa1 family membrane protein insertase